MLKSREAAVLVDTGRLLRTSTEQFKPFTVAQMRARSFLDSNPSLTKHKVASRARALAR
jgi:hypothetical protein